MYNICLFRSVKSAKPAVAVITPCAASDKPGSKDGIDPRRLVLSSEINSSSVSEGDVVAHHDMEKSGIFGKLPHPVSCPYS